ncbi:MAG TPA: hypothetical protein VFC16_16430, partial [Nakamurella sp.]|nr:hypothetical protein [Nakamurella sp.]
MGAAGRISDRRVAEDVLPPALSLSVPVDHRIPALGDVRGRVAAIVEVGRVHAGVTEHAPAQVIPVAGSGHRLDCQAEEDVARVAVP